MSRPCGYCMVAPGSEGVGTFVLSKGEPSSRQKLSASSVYVRLHWGQRFIEFVVSDYCSKSRFRSRKWLSENSTSHSPQASEAVSKLLGLFFTPVG